MVTGGSELLKLVQLIQQERDIDPETLFVGLESAIEAAIRRKYTEATEFSVQIDRESGYIYAYRDGISIEAQELGRIAAQTAKQVMAMKFREAEQDAIIGEYESRLHDLISGTIARFERDDIIVNLAKGEGILPRTERVRGETPRVGDRIRAIVLGVRRVGNRVLVVLSRTHPDFVRRLFELEVPEIEDGLIEIKHLAREPGYRTKMGVVSYDPKIHPVGACVGLRGSRIRNVTDELNGERVDVIPWDDSAEVLIMHALQPAVIDSITLNDETGEAEVVVADDQLSLAIGRRGQNVRLAAKLTGWMINIVSASQLGAQSSADASAEFDALLGDRRGAPEGESPVALDGFGDHDERADDRRDAIVDDGDLGEDPNEATAWSDEQSSSVHAVEVEPDADASEADESDAGSGSQA